MDENNVKSASERQIADVTESPKTLAFTIDFGERKCVDTQRHKSLVEKFQKRHRRGQSLSKLEESSTNPQSKKAPSTGNLPRKSSIQSSEGYFSADEKSDKNSKSGRSVKQKSDLSLPLKSMSSSFPSSNLPSISSPEIELKDISSPELDLVSTFSPNVEVKALLPTNTLVQQYSSPDCEQPKLLEDTSDLFVDGTEFDFDKSDTVSDAGTYTVEDNYSEEQKARISIDQEFKIEEVSVMKKTQEYVLSLNGNKSRPVRSLSTGTSGLKTQKVIPKLENIKSNVTKDILRDISSVKSPLTPNSLLSPTQNSFVFKSPLIPAEKTSFHTSESVPNYEHKKSNVLSPILSPTQNLSITNDLEEQSKQNRDDLHNKTFTKIMFPSPKAKTGIGLEQIVDQGSVISVTSSGAFRSKVEKDRKHMRQMSLSKSEVHVEAYMDDSVVPLPNVRTNAINLTTNIINVQSIPMKNGGTKSNVESNFKDSTFMFANLALGKVSNLPHAIGAVSGKTSPTKIPSPVHNISRPRSRNSISSLNVDLSDSSLETESYLNSTQNYILALERRLPSENEQDSDYDGKFNVPLNNDTKNLLKQKLTHIRHNSFDDRNLKVMNKLEHFQNKNLQGIDQTAKVLNQYSQNKLVHKIQNSPNNSPIRRSSSFSTKNQINPKNVNILQKESNIRNSPNFNRNGSIQRSASTASIKPNAFQQRRCSINSDHKIDRNQFADTESSSEEDFERTQRKKDLSSITNTKYNRAFALRRARLDVEPAIQIPPKCPNTPEMRRKFQPDHARAISVDRKPVKTNDVQSRYLASKKTPMPKQEVPKTVPKASNKITPNKSQVFSRTDSGRFSMKSVPKTPAHNVQKNARKESGKKSGGRSNSSLSSREIEFQNWKRRKSYDPMKAAAEGKRKAELVKKQNCMVQSCIEANQTQDCDSSPSHSSSVHRSQSFHGTAALEQLLSSDEEDDFTLSADEAFSPPTPSPCELSPARASLRHAWKDHRLPY